MSKAGKPIPEGYHSLTPHITVKGAKQAIEFYKKAFGAKQRVEPFMGPDGTSVMHAELQIGDSMLMLNDEFPDWGCFGPATKGSGGWCIHLYVSNADEVFEQAVKAGAAVTMPIQNMFWGDRYGKVKDPFGHEWSIATHKEDLTREQLAERASCAMATSS
jgi:PhnB protein